VSARLEVLTTPRFSDAERERIRRQAFEDAATRVQGFRMPRPGDGPLIFLDVIEAIARELRGMK
jgi:hypothetical protein